LGDQLVILYLPLLLTSVLVGYSAFTKRKTRFSIELVLLLWGTAILFLSQSRIGLLSAMAVVGVLVLSAGWTQTGKLAGRIGAGRGTSGEGASRRDPKLLRLVLWILFVLVLFLAAFSTLWLVSKFDWRIERIFNLDLQEVLEGSQYPLHSLAEEVAFAERVVYWENGFRIFSRYPLFGAGLGNTGFFFRENASGYGYHLPEIIFILTAAPEFPNAKSLWVRLLAETGVVGFTVFVTWLISLVKGGLSLLRRIAPIQRMIGLAGLLSLVALIFEGFSLDTFALPHLWVMLGLVTAALSIDPTVQDQE
jgi:O-antigen ligase